MAPVSETETESIERVVASLSATFPLVAEGEIRDCVTAAIGASPTPGHLVAG